jgi:dTDP-4-dehydrorhamnose reductase
MSKYLGEQLAIDENPRTMIVRTSWLYGGFAEDRRQKTEDRKVFKNFVNTMLRLSETRDQMKVVDDQHGIPTSCVDLSFAIAELIEANVDADEVGGIFHLSNSCEQGSITWADFAREIFTLS